MFEVSRFLSPAAWLLRRVDADLFRACRTKRRQETPRHRRLRSACCATCLPGLWFGETVSAESGPAHILPSSWRGERSKKQSRTGKQGVHIMSQDGHRSGGEHDIAEDVKILHGMGYAQELLRRMSGFSNFAISFSIICILAGGINSLGQAIGGVGGAAIGIGWPLGCLVSLVFALGMGADRLGLSDRRRALPLGLDPGRTGAGLGHRLVQPARPDHRARRRSMSAPSCSWSAPSAPSSASRARSGPSGDLPGAADRQPGAAQPSRHPGHHPADRLQRLPDLPGRDRADHRLPGLCPGDRLLAAVDLHQLQRPGRRRRLAAAQQHADGVPAGPAAADLHHHRLRRLGPHLGGDGAGLLQRAAVDRAVGGAVRRVRLRHAGRLRAGDPEHGRGRGPGLERVLLDRRTRCCRLG